MQVYRILRVYAKKKFLWICHMHQTYIKETIWLCHAWCPMHMWWTCQIAIFCLVYNGPAIYKTDANEMVQSTHALVSRPGSSHGLLYKHRCNSLTNKTKVIRADLLDFAFDLDFYFEDIFRFGNISVLVTFQFWWHFSFDDILVLVTF